MICSHVNVMTHVSYLCAILKNVETLRLYTSMPHCLVTFFLMLPLGVRVSHWSNVYFNLRNYSYHWVKAIAWIEFVIVSIYNHCKYLLCQCRLEELISIFIACSYIFPCFHRKTRCKALLNNFPHLRLSYDLRNIQTNQFYAWIFVPKKQNLTLQMKKSSTARISSSNFTTLSFLYT